ncbi:putative elongation factor EF-Ts [Candidatus Carsonella ruddii HT isolate Thao2000]|uniref:Putative elongation factor EF-Ts n=1 Tax=Candidatus Carsonella ruddii HT isolate Thao2000 TaxID=1202539 RepID=J3TEE1_CARRU|nr:hypothetical protein [Candidatus Carsonella ruddii]AFP84067.1 putative elongation factor EF-Ts [Candidatus Carsonella ruddii HT isolate Thao2000]
MLNIELIKKIKNKFNLSIGDSKKFLEKNSWNYDKTIHFINNKKMYNINFNYDFFSILTINRNNNIILIKILFNSIIIKNSNIIDKFKLDIENDFNLKNIKNKIHFLSIKLKENILLDKILIFSNKNVYYYNHKNDFFCIIKYKKLIINLCYQIIFKKINFLNYKCKNSFINQIFIKNNTIINKLINIKTINFIFLINNKNEYFYYE